MSEMTLRMPSTYVDIDREEMEYVDGGWYVVKCYYYNRYGKYEICITGFAAFITGVKAFKA